MALAALNLEDLPHYNYDEYVHWEGSWEIISGIPYAMAPAPVMKHQRLSVKIASQLDQLLAGCRFCKTYTAIDWQVEKDTVVQPDVLVVCGESSEKEKLSVPPLLIIEILSPSTARKDRGLKYQLYREAGVRYYCLIDPANKSVEIFELHELTGDEACAAQKKYKEIKEFQEGKMFFDFDKCSIAFDFGKVFE
ncbi:MAG: Uma2 family endonuclease [Candidatus Aminicenantes bacterium]|nr:Uma2 family endonuclease [Candidatus Aminicenantes bacterium]